MTARVQLRMPRGDGAMPPQTGTGPHTGDIAGDTVEESFHLTCHTIGQSSRLSHRRTKPTAIQYIALQEPDPGLVAQE